MVRWQNGDASDCKSLLQEFDSLLNLTKRRGKKEEREKRTNIHTKMKPQRVRRDQAITTEDVQQLREVHNGRAWIKVRPTLESVGMKFGEWAKTRTPRSLSQKKKGKK